MVLENRYKKSFPIDQSVLGGFIGLGSGYKNLFTCNIGLWLVFGFVPE